MNRQLATLPRIAGAALAIAAAATFSIAGAAAAQAGEQHTALGSSPQVQTAQLQSDGYGIGGHGVSAQSDGYGIGGHGVSAQADGYGIGGLAVSVQVSVQTDIQKPGH
jgi:hypothetical protein